MFDSVALCCKINCILFTCNAGSKRNSSMSTLDGVDVMGDRLAEEVCYGLLIKPLMFLFSIVVRPES